LNKNCISEKDNSGYLRWPYMYSTKLVHKWICYK
jgi:hypothetical protein